MKSKNSTQSEITSYHVKPSDILREAANYLLSNSNRTRKDGCCYAIEYAGEILKDFSGAGCKVHNLFASLYESNWSFWFGAPHKLEDNDRRKDISKTLQGRQEHRVMALLLCADYAESEGM